MNYNEIFYKKIIVTPQLAVTIIFSLVSSISFSSISKTFSENPGDLTPRGKFGSPPASDIFELHDKTLGIIGIGRIGSAFCKKTSPFFHQVLAYDPYKPEDYFKELSAQAIMPGIQTGPHRNFNGERHLTYLIFSQETRLKIA